MKVSDFRLIATLPDSYDYELFNDGKGHIMVLGKTGQEVIGFRIINEELRPISFEVIPKGDDYR